MAHAHAKKIDAVTWEQIVMEAMTALTDGSASVSVATDEIYRWIEETEYLTDYGRAVDPNWQEDTPSYRASLQLRWQRMVAAHQLLRVQSGVYRLPHPVSVSVQDKWQALLLADKKVAEPETTKVTVRRIQRSQKLRDLLVNYYGATCQICAAKAPFLIPTAIAGRFYVEVHHVLGLAEAVALRQNGALVGLKVNGLSNLTVLCPHHHAMMHHHWPAFEFDRPHLLWRTASGNTLPLLHITKEHAALLQTPSEAFA